MQHSELTNEFVAKVDAFAASLDPEEQVMLMQLLVEEDVAGFADFAKDTTARPAWPGLMNLGLTGSISGGNSQGGPAHEAAHIIQQRGQNT